MLFYYDIPKINQVLDDFFNATGVRIDLLNDQFIPISYSQHEICDYCRAVQQKNGGRERCVAFDQSLYEKVRCSLHTESGLCPFGLMNIIKPVFYNDLLMGYLFFGQMRTQQQHETENSLFDALPLFTQSQVESVARLAAITVKHILTENMLRPEANNLLQQTLNFIHNNLNQDLSIKMLTKQVNVSKSALYSKFHERLHCTVGEYINQKRLEQSVPMLINTTLSIEEVSRRVGFANASYYTKLFKQQMGITPLKFRKNKQEEKLG